MKIRHLLKKVSPFSLTFSVILSVITLLFLFTPNVLIFKQFEKHGTPLFTFFCFFSGLVFIFLKKEKLMFVAFICCTLLCLYLRSSYGLSTHPFQSKNTSLQENQFSTSLISLEKANREYDKIINLVLRNEPDVISFLDYMPDWHGELSSRLDTVYPFKKKIPQLDFYGMGIYSKYDFTVVDSFDYKGIPNLLVAMRHPTLGIIHQLVSNTTPVLNSNDYKSLNEHLDLLAAKTELIENRKIAIGNYNIVPFSQEIQSFREKSNLKISSRSYLPSHTTGNIFYSPLDHIFYSEDLKCISLVELKTDKEHVGLKGVYSLNY